MKLIKIKYLIAALALVSASSCESYLLEENPNQVTTDSYWAGLDQTKATLFAAYGGLRSEYILNVRTEAWRSDMGWPGFGRPQPQNNADGWSYYTQAYNNSSKFVISKWNDSYTIIWRANQAIEALEALKSSANIDMDEWTTQMAQARFLRGLVYFYLYSAFNEGSVVLKKETPKVNSDFYQGLAPAEDVYDFYNADLEYALKNLPATSEEVTMPAKAAAATILGTSYLYEGDYDTAATYFKQVIDDKSLALEEDLTKMFTTAGEFNSESILEIAYSTEHRPDYGDWDNGRMINPLGLFSKGIVGFLMPSWLIIEYMNDPMDPKVAMNYENGVLRSVSHRASSMCALVMDQSSLYYGKFAVEVGQEMAGGDRGSWGFGKYKKYTNHDIWTLESHARSGKNVTVNRLSDVYLMYAECLIQGSKKDVQGALDYINEVRKRWGLVLLGTGTDVTRTYNGETYTAESLMERLMYVERPLEMSVEGHQTRWQDLRRWGLLGDNDKNIFKRHAAETFYAITPKGLVTTEGKPATMATKLSVVVTEKPTTGVEGTDYVVIDYEYDEASDNYTSKGNLYYDISSDEQLNNPNL